MRILSKKLAIALISVSMSVLPSMHANAQAAGNGTIMGVSTTAFVVGAVVVIGAIAYNVNANDRDSRTLILVPVETSTATQTIVVTNPAATTTTTTN